MRIWPKGTIRQEKRAFFWMVVIALPLGAFAYWAHLEFVRLYLGLP